MKVEDFLNSRGIYPEHVQFPLGREGLSESMLGLMTAAESRLLEIDQRLEILRHLLLIVQPRRIGRVELIWRQQHGQIRPRVIKWQWSKRKRRWLPWTLPDTQIHRHLRRTGPFRTNHPLARVLVSLLAHLLRLRSDLLNSIHAITRPLRLRVAHDPFLEIDVALDRMARDVFNAPLA